MMGPFNPEPPENGTGQWAINPADETLQPVGTPAPLRDPASPEPVDSGHPDPALERLTQLVATLDRATARFQEAHDFEAIPAIVGAALQSQGIESHISLLDAPLPANGHTAAELLANQRLRVVYASVLHGHLAAIERLIGRSAPRVTIALGQVEAFARAITTRQALYLSQTAEIAQQSLPWMAESGLRRLLQMVGASTAVVAPLLSRGRVLGVMGMWSNDLRPEDATVLGAFARQTGIAMDNARLLSEVSQGQERLEAQMRRAETLAQVALALGGERELAPLLGRIAQAARDLTSADGAGFLLRAGPESAFEVVGAVGVSEQIVRVLRRPYVPGFSWLRALLREGRPVLFADAQQIANRREAWLLARAQMRAFAATPLLTGHGWVSGALVVCHHAPAAFTQEHADLLSALAAQASAAIERTGALEEARRRADELEAMFASVTAGMAISDLNGDMLRINAAGERITRRSQLIGETPAERAQRFGLRLPDGRPVPVEEMPSLRAARGEVLHGLEYLVDGEDGADTRISVSGGPLYGVDGSTRGSVLEFRNVTHVRRLEQRTQEALDTLLRIAAALVAPQEVVAEQSGIHAQAPHAVHVSSGNGTGGILESPTSRLETFLGYLGQLVGGMLEARRVFISLVDPQTGNETPGAAVGLTEAERGMWLAEFDTPHDRPRFGAINPEAATRLRDGEMVLVDFRRPPYEPHRNPFHIETALVVPMLVEDVLMGILMLDRPASNRAAVGDMYSRRERALAQGVARLAALAVQRERLEGVASEVEALRAANALKEEFLSIASHELKTPLTVLQARTQATQRRLQRMGQTEAAEQFAPVQASLNRLHGLVRELLDATRIEVGRPRLRQEPIHLGRLASALVQEAREASGRAITLVGENAPDLWIVGDPDRLTQVLTNLLDNAQKYGPPDDAIAVRVWRAPAGTEGRRDVGAWAGYGRIWEDGERPLEGEGADEIVVTVADRGVGIPLDEMAFVFERFYRARTSSSRQYGGLGLGLHIAANIVEWHHGRIWVISPGPGLGSTFGVALPAGAAPQMPAAPEV